MIRMVEGLRWAREINRPNCIPIGKATRGPKAQGVRYERQVAFSIGDARNGVWFEFEDENGRGYCQVDLMWQHGGAVVVGECKYTWTPDAMTKLLGLYVPVVRRAYNKHVVPLVICKVLTPECRRLYVAGDLDEAVYWAAAGRPVVYHFLGTMAAKTSLRSRARVARR